MIIKKLGPPRTVRNTSDYVKQVRKAPTSPQANTLEPLTLQSSKINARTLQLSRLSLTRSFHKD